MSNHFHLLIRERDEKVGDTIKRIASSYVYYYNRKNGRDGHLFKERFKSEPVNDMEYFITLLRYIHQNHVKAGIAKRVEDYNFSSPSKARPSDDQVWQLIKDLTGVTNCTSFQKLGDDIKRSVLKLLKDKGASFRQLERLTGIGRGLIQKL